MVGFWSVAQVTPRISQGRALYAHVAATLPACMARFWRSHFLPPTSARPGVRVAPRSVPHLGDEQVRWTITVTPRETSREPGVFDVVVVREGRSVAQYVYSWGCGIIAIRQALQRG